MHLRAHNLAVELPQGWDGRIYARHVEAAGHRHALRHVSPRPAAATLHAANFALPGGDGDFGTKATATMPTRGAFLALTEYVQGNGLRAGTGLFARKGAPRALRAELFSPHALLLARPGQMGFQRFFTDRGRPLCLYVVLGSSEEMERLLAPLNRVLASVAIEAGAPSAHSDVPGGPGAHQR